MNNHQTNMKFERIRLTETDKKRAIAIGIVPSLLFSIVLRILWKTKRWLAILSMIFFLGWSINFLAPHAFSPKADATRPVVAEEPQSEHAQIVSYIKEVFGKYSDQALSIATCESGLNPQAINDNTSWGGVGIDRGIFQLNSVYQRIDNPNFLYNWKINIDMAYVIFKNAGYNWHLWSCGRKLGL